MAWAPSLPEEVSTDERLRRGHRQEANVMAVADLWG
jgi:hypothetical protein